MLEFLFKSVSLAILVPIFMLISGCGGCTATMIGVKLTTDTAAYSTGDADIVVTKGRWSNDSIISAFQDGKLHSRDGNPAVKGKFCTIWAEDGLIHRNPDEGPALILLDGNGVSYHYYVVYNAAYSSKEEAIEAFKHPSRPQYGMMTWVDGKEVSFADILNKY